MPLFNRGTLQDQAQLYRGRYRYATGSPHPEDKANAEAYRIAADMYQQIANDMIEPDGMPELETYTNSLRGQWDKFVATGIIDDDMLETELAHVAEREDRKGQPARRPRLDAALREHVSPRAIESILAEMSEILGVDYTPPPIKLPGQAQGLPEEAATQPVSPSTKMDRKREPATK